ncbi:MAG: hypothetical protein ACOCTT_02590 [archaeon]
MKIEQVIDNYKNKKVEANPVFAKRQKKLYDLIFSYNHGQFLNDPYEDNGWRNVFRSVVDSPNWVATKEIDVDTKNINFISRPGQKETPVWLLEKEFRTWMMESGFDMFLNKLAYRLPRWGSVFVKKVGSGNDLFIPNIRNMYYDPLADTEIGNVDIVEKHSFNIEELEEVGEEKDWKNIKKAKERMDKDREVVDIYEFYKTNGKRRIVAGKKFDVVLDEGKFSELPYKKVDWEEVFGRFTGKGVTEKLFEEQINANDVENMFRQALQFSSKFLFYTPDSRIKQNLMTEVDNGHMFDSVSGISQVDMQNRNLNSFQYSEQRIKSDVQDKTFAYESMRGQTPASGVPMGTTVMQNRKAMGYYSFMQENFGSFLKELIKDWVIPSFKKEKKKIHKFTMNGTEEELDKFDELYVDAELRKRKAEFRRKNNHEPNVEQAQIMEGIIRKKLSEPGGREIEVPKDYYENLDYKMEIVITGESVDTQARQQAISFILQMANNNPQALQDPYMRKIISKSVELSGLSPKDILPPKENVGLEAQISARTGEGASRERGRTREREGGLQRGGSISPRGERQKVQETQTRIG